MSDKWHNSESQYTDIYDGFSLFASFSFA